MRVAPQNLPAPHPMPLDPLNQSLRDQYFGNGDQPHRPFNDVMSITTASGKPLLTLWRWSMTPNHAEAVDGNAAGGQNTAPGYRVSATFDSPAGEHYYGLGQQQQGLLIYVITAYTAGTITRPSAEKTSAFPSWCRAAATGSSGTTHQKQPSISASISKMCGLRKWATEFLSL